MDIGNLHLDNNIFLAPMAGITDLPFRMICKRYGCGFVYSEMVSAKGLYYGDKKTSTLLAIDDIEKPCAVQIFGSEPHIMAQIAEKAAATGASVIDINMGCPTPKIVNNGDGSALMKNPKLAGEIVKAVSAAINLPVTVKIRKGWDDSCVNAVEFAKVLEDNGASAIAVHGRTSRQFYSGEADWDIIRDVKSSLSIPVIGNGDVKKPEDVLKILDYTGCDGVMIGRAAQGNPFIFKQINELITTGKVLYEPSTQDRISQAIEHVEMLVEFKGESRGIKEARKHVAWYIKGLPQNAKLKEKIFKINNLEQMKITLLEYIQHYI